MGRMMKISAVVAAVLAIVVAVMAVMINSWCDTPHGRLDPRAALLLRYIDVTGTKMIKEGVSLQESRRITDEKGLILRAAPMPVYHVRDEAFPGPGGEVPIRIYHPGKGDNCPAIIYYHGGGFFIGNLESHDNVCRRFANHARAVVISVDYRLAPEHQFPAAVDDAYAALEWVHKNAASLKIDPDRIAVAGDSAGGTLSAAVSYLARERKGPKIACQALIYPASNFVDKNTKSRKDFAEGFFLTGKYMDFFLTNYAPKQEQWQDPRLSPALMAEVKGLPPAVIITAGFDPLRDEGESFGQRLKAAGVPVSMKRYQGLLHGFIVMDRIFPQADQAVRHIAGEIVKLVPSWNKGQE